MCKGEKMGDCVMLKACNLFKIAAVSGTVTFHQDRTMRYLNYIPKTDRNNNNPNIK